MYEDHRWARTARPTPTCLCDVTKQTTYRRYNLDPTRAPQGLAVHPAPPCRTGEREQRSGAQHTTYCEYDAMPRPCRGRARLASPRRSRAPAARRDVDAGPIEQNRRPPRRAGAWETSPALRIETSPAVIRLPRSRLGGAGCREAELAEPRSWSPTGPEGPARRDAMGLPSTRRIAPTHFNPDITHVFRGGPGRARLEGAGRSRRTSG